MPLERGVDGARNLGGVGDVDIECLPVEAAFGEIGVEAGDAVLGGAGDLPRIEPERDDRVPALGETEGDRAA
jgi:hypothetical protein